MRSKVRSKRSLRAAAAGGQSVLPADGEGCGRRTCRFLYTVNVTITGLSQTAY